MSLDQIRSNLENAAMECERILPLRERPEYWAVERARYYTQERNRHYRNAQILRRACSAVVLICSAIGAAIWLFS